MANSPRWPTETTQRLNQLCELFKSNLKTVAESFAKHENAEAVLVRHVEEAYAALARLGLTSRRWYERTEFWTGIGGLLIGLAFALPDLLAAFMDDSAKRTGVTIGAIVVMGLIGIFFYAFAWARGSLPRQRR